MTNPIPDFESNPHEGSGGPAHVVRIPAGHIPEGGAGGSGPAEPPRSAREVIADAVYGYGYSGEAPDPVLGDRVLERLIAAGWRVQRDG